VIGGAMGAAVAVLLTRVLVGIAPAGIPRIDEVGIDHRVLLFALVTSLATGLLFGVTAAIPATRGSLIAPIREGSGGQSAGRQQGVARNLLVVGEVALTMVLLAGAGLLVTTFLFLRSVDTGYDPAGVMVVDFPRVPAGYDGPEAWWRFQQEALERLRAIPGVEEAATTSTVPLQGQYNIPITVDGRAELSEPAAQWRAISPRYLEAIRARMAAGRTFTEADRRQGPHVAIVNESFATHYFPEGGAVGERVQVAMMEAEPVHPSLEVRDAEIVGVVADMRELWLQGSVPRTVYVPQSQVGEGMSFAPSFVLRTRGRVELDGQVLAAFREVNPQVTLPRVRPLDALVGESMAGQRFNAAMVGSFAALALLLTAVGIYGVLTYSVRQRTREVAIRLALGARAGTVVGAVVRQGVTLVGVGLLIGLAAALLVTRAIAGLLYGVQPSDPLTLGSVALLLLGIGAVAAYLPARRAARVDPMVALRAE